MWKAAPAGTASAAEEAKASGFQGAALLYYS